MEDSSVHYYSLAHYVRGYGGDDITCKDCKHFDADKHPTIHGFVSIAGHCDKRVADGYDEYPHPDCDDCDVFEPTHESVGNALDALDSWESVSK